MGTVYAKALWERRHSLAGWSVAVATLILLEAALWPSMQSMRGLEDYLAEFPDALKEMFGIDQMSTGQGFLNAELFSLMLPLMVITYAVGHGARLIAGEQESGGLDLLLVTPLTTTRMLTESALALVTGVALLGACVAVSTYLGSLAFGLGIGPRAAANGALAVTLLGVEFGLVALVFGALSGRRSLAVAGTAAVGLLAYVVYLGGAFVDGLADWRRISPFDQALSAGPLGQALPASAGWLVAVPILLVLAALPLWGRRDL